MPETNDPPKRRGRPPKVKPAEPAGWIGPAEAAVLALAQEAELRPLPIGYVTQGVAMAQLIHTVRLKANESQSLHASATCTLTLTSNGIRAEEAGRVIVVPFSNVRFYQLA